MVPMGSGGGFKVSEDALSVRHNSPPFLLEGPYSLPPPPVRLLARWKLLRSLEVPPTLSSKCPILLFCLVLVLFPGPVAPLESSRGFFSEGFWPPHGSPTKPPRCDSVRAPPPSTSSTCFSHWDLVERRAAHFVLPAASLVLGGWNLPPPLWLMKYRH